MCPAPFKPELSSDVDVSCFPVEEIPQDDDAVNEPTRCHPDAAAPSVETRLPFVGYTYKAFPAHDLVKF